MDSKKAYEKEREEASYRIIDESMMRKLGRSFPQGYKSVNPVQKGHTDNSYSPLKW